MTAGEAHDLVLSMMTEMFEVPRDKIAPDTNLQDLDLDSIDAIDLAVKLQQMSGRRVDENLLRQLRTVADVEALIQRHFAAPGP
ncbi:MAG: acyl carrier protein [Myxococcales bacterium]